MLAEAPAASETRPSTEAATSASASPSSSASASASASAAAPAGASAGASGTAKDLTAPGTKLGLGEKAVTHTNTGKDTADAKYTEATYTTSVTKITAGAEADLAALKDAAKFAGQTPYYVFTEHTLDSLSKPSAGISEPRLNAQLKDGTDAQKLIIIGSLDQCPTKRFETTGSSDNLSYKVGSTMTSVPGLPRTRRRRDRLRGLRRFRLQLRKLQRQPVPQEPDRLVQVGTGPARQRAGRPTDAGAPRSDRSAPAAVNAS